MLIIPVVLECNRWHVGLLKPTLLLDRGRARRLLKDSRDVLHSFTESSPRCGAEAASVCQDQWVVLLSAPGTGRVFRNVARWGRHNGVHHHRRSVGWLVGVRLICARHPHQLLVEIKEKSQNKVGVPLPKPLPLLKCGVRLTPRRV